MFDWASVLCTLGFILCDLVSGFLKAARAHNISSSAMRDGLWHKCGFIFCIVVAMLCEFSMQHLDLGFTAPIVTPVCVFICLTELISVFENICEISPELANSKVASLFNIDVSERHG